LRELQTGVQLEPGKQRLSDFIQHWLEHQAPRLTNRSLERYETIARKYIVPALGSALLSQLRPSADPELLRRAPQTGQVIGPCALLSRNVTCCAEACYATAAHSSQCV
jgi:hypothetical protein